MEQVWLKQYPRACPAEIDVNQYPSLVALLDESFRRYADRMAYKFMGRAISFARSTRRRRRSPPGCRRRVSPRATASRS
jgi:long-chain acyl-CoA synthetase